MLISFHIYIILNYLLCLYYVQTLTLAFVAAEGLYIPCCYAYNDHAVANVVFSM